MRAPERFPPLPLTLRSVVVLVVVLAVRKVRGWLR